MKKVLINVNESQRKMISLKDIMYQRSRTVDGHWIPVSSVSHLPRETAILYQQARSDLHSEFIYVSLC